MQWFKKSDVNTGISEEQLFIIFELQNEINLGFAQPQNLIEWLLKGVNLRLT